MSAGFTRRVGDLLNSCRDRYEVKDEEEFTLDIDAADNNDTQSLGASKME